MDAIDKIVYKWLNLMNTNPPLGITLHTSAILAAGATEHAVASASGVLLSPSSASSDAINKAYEYIRDPNIEGIVVHAEKESCSRDIEVSQRQVLSVEGDSSEDTSSQRKKYIVDNAVPKLREWQLEGYIMTSDVFCRGLTVKPDLILKLMMLDSYSKARLPVLFKSSDMRFYKVLITHYDYAYDPKATNAAAVNITLQEFSTVNITSTATEIIKRAIARS